MHNLVRLRDGHKLEDTMYVIGFEDDNENVTFARAQRTVPENGEDYFVGQEAVSWQDSKIY